MEANVSHVVQVGGALPVLAAFALAQARIVTPQARVYLVLNLVGAAVLAVDAYVETQWGFLLLEGVWTLVSLRGVLRWWLAGRRRRGVGPATGIGTG